MEHPAQAATTRIAMWSGPRNISTAMMRAWGNRDDTYVCDEPLYAHYLIVTGLDHPARQEILRSQEGDWRKVVAWLAGDVPAGKRIFYQKHMAHHLLPEIGREWLARVSHAFLIRDPAEMLTSLARVIPSPSLPDTGLPQQCALFDEIRRREGQIPPVLDARDVLEDPAGRLEALCAALDVRFQPAMLAWPAGARATDGVWAPHWYGSVERSTGFAPYQPPREALPERLRELCRECRPLYDRLHRHRLRA